MKCISIEYSLMLFSLFIGFSVYSQTAPNKYFVKFTDKNNSPYSISNPSEFLSQRAIERRLNHNIPVDYLDLPVNKTYIQAVESKGAVVLTRSKWFNAVTVFAASSAVIDSIMQLPFVASVQKSSNLKTAETVNDKFPVLTAEKSLFSAQDETDFFNYGDAFTQIHQVNGQVLHNNGFRGNGMVISVIDAGFNLADTLAAFDTLWNSNRIIGWRDFVRSGNNLFLATHSHGMYVLSIMGANMPGAIVGTAPNASYWLLRTEDGSSENLIEEDNWVAAAEFADSAGTDIINTSLGYSTFDNPALSHTHADLTGNTTRVAQGLNIASRKGILCVTAAGNSGSSTWRRLLTPGDADSSLTIGAVDGFGNYASFSSVGPSADGDVKPSVVAMGQGTAFVALSGNVSVGNGTSFSTPVIAGLAACLWQAHPEYSNMEIANAIIKSAHMYSNPDSLMGHGIPDFGTAEYLLKYQNSTDDSRIRIFPNPFTDHLSVDFYSPDSQNVKVEVLNLLGQKIIERIFYTAGKRQNRFLLDNINHLNRGVYIIRVSAKNRSFINKVVLDKK